MSTKIFINPSIFPQPQAPEAAESEAAEPEAAESEAAEPEAAEPEAAEPEAALPADGDKYFGKQELGANSLQSRLHLRFNQWLEDDYASAQHEALKHQKVINDLKKKRATKIQHLDPQAQLPEDYASVLLEATYKGLSAEQKAKFFEDLQEEHSTHLTDSITTEEFYCPVINNLGQSYSRAFLAAVTLRREKFTDPNTNEEFLPQVISNTVLMRLQRNPLDPLLDPITQMPMQQPGFLVDESGIPIPDSFIDKATWEKSQLAVLSQYPSAKRFVKDTRCCGFIDAREALCKKYFPDAELARPVQAAGAAAAPAPDQDTLSQARQFVQAGQNAKAEELLNQFLKSKKLDPSSKFTASLLLADLLYQRSAFEEAGNLLGEFFYPSIKSEQTFSFITELQSRTLTQLVLWDRRSFDFDGLPAKLASKEYRHTAAPYLRALVRLGDSLRAKANEKTTDKQHSKQLKEAAIEVYQKAISLVRDIGYNYKYLKSVEDSKKTGWFGWMHKSESLPRLASWDFAEESYWYCTALENILYAQGFGSDRRQLQLSYLREEKLDDLGNQDQQKIFEKVRARANLMVSQNPQNYVVQAYANALRAKIEVLAGQAKAALAAAEAAVKYLAKVDPAKDDAAIRELRIKAAIQYAVNLDIILPFELLSKEEYVDDIKHLNRALQATQRALILDPSRRGLLYNRARILHRLGYTQDAIKTLQQSLRISPNDSKARKTLWELTVLDFAARASAGKLTAEDRIQLNLFLRERVVEAGNNERALKELIALVRNHIPVSERAPIYEHYKKLTFSSQKVWKFIQVELDETREGERKLKEESERAKEQICACFGGEIFEEYFELFQGYTSYIPAKVSVPELMFMRNISDLVLNKNNMLPAKLVLAHLESKDLCVAATAQEGGWGSITPDFELKFYLFFISILFEKLMSLEPRERNRLGYTDEFLDELNRHIQTEINKFESDNSSRNQTYSENLKKVWAVVQPKIMGLIKEAALETPSALSDDLFDAPPKAAAASAPPESAGTPKQTPSAPLAASTSGTPQAVPSAPSSALFAAAGATTPQPASALPAPKY